VRLPATLRGADFLSGPSARVAVIRAGAVADNRLRANCARWARDDVQAVRKTRPPPNCAPWARDDVQAVRKTRSAPELRTVGT
jgi:hypothetical protein